MEKRFIGNCTLMLSCPKVRAILASLTSADLSTQMFPWLSAQEIEVAGIPVGAMRVSFVGESGWELHDPIAAQVRLATALFDSGKNYQIAWVGLRAMDSRRIEKCTATGAAT